MDSGKEPENNYQIVSGFGTGKPFATIGVTLKVNINGTEQYIRVDLTEYGETLREAIEKVRKEFSQAVQAVISDVTRLLVGLSQPAQAQPSAPPAQPQYPAFQPQYPASQPVTAPPQPAQVPGRPYNAIDPNINNPIDMLKALDIKKDWGYKQKLQAVDDAYKQNRITSQQYQVLKDHFKPKR